MSQVAQVSEHHASHPDQLAGWKEIGWYLGRGTRTVQRWERELGLPVHRLATGPGRAIYAYRSEIDAWRCRQAEAQAPRDGTPTAAGASADSPMAIAAARLGASCTTLVSAVVADRPGGASSGQRGTNYRVTITVDINVGQPGDMAGTDDREGEPQRD